MFSSLPSLGNRRNLRVESSSMDQRWVDRSRRVLRCKFDRRERHARLCYKKEFCAVPVPFDTINGTPEGKSRYNESIFVRPTGQQMTAKLRMCVGECSKNGLSWKVRFLRRWQRRNTRPRTPEHAVAAQDALVAIADACTEYRTRWVTFPASWLLTLRPTMRKILRYVSLII